VIIHSRSHPLNFYFKQKQEIMDGDSDFKKQVEPNWEEKWEDIVSHVTYAGVKLNSCKTCGDMDRNYCECAKEVWIADRREEFRINK
jgi:hypothetical protein